MALVSPQDSIADLGNFPTTRYQGSKRKIVPWIYEHLRELDFSSAVDVFGGTGSVAYLMKRMGKRVCYNDVLRFNYLTGCALIANDDVTLSDEEISALKLPPGNRDRGHSLVADEFEGYYFTPGENRHIDTICSRIATEFRDSEVYDSKRALAYHALFQTCLVKRPFNQFHRKNLYIRFARVTRSFGNKRTWDRSISSHFATFAKETNGFVFRGEKKCTATNCDALSIDLSKYDLVYVDPPYLTQQGERADYLKRYHFLEGLSRYHEWSALMDRSSRIKEIKATRENPWVDRTRNKEAFDQLFDNARKSILVISYKKFGVPSLRTLQRLLKRHGRKVRTFTKHYIYALNHQNGNAAFNREALLIAS